MTAVAGLGPLGPLGPLGMAPPQQALPGMGVPGAAPWDTLPGMPSLGMRAPRRLGEISAFEDEHPSENAEKAEDEASNAVEEAMKSEVDKMSKQKEKVLENDPDTNRIAHDTADAVNIYTQNKMMPMFSGHSSKEIRDLVDESRQLLHAVHKELRQLKEAPPDTGAAAAAEGNAAKQAQKGKTSALLLWSHPPLRGRGADFLG